MSDYIIPDGWNPMTEPWEEGRIVNKLYADGIIAVSIMHAFTDRYRHFGTYPVAWQYPVPLQKKRRFEVRQYHDSNKEIRFYVYDALTCSQPEPYHRRKDFAELIAKYLEENEP